MDRYSWEMGFSNPMTRNARVIERELNKVFSDSPSSYTPERYSIARLALSYKQDSNAENGYHRRTMSPNQIRNLSRFLEMFMYEQGAEQCCLWVDQQLSKRVPRENRQGSDWIALGTPAYISVPVVYHYGNVLADMELEVQRGWITIEHMAGMMGQGLYRTARSDNLVCRPVLWGLNTEARMREAAHGVVAHGKQTSPDMNRVYLASVIVQGVVRAGSASMRDGDHESVVAWANAQLTSVPIEDIVAMEPPGTLSTQWSPSGNRWTGKREWVPWLYNWNRRREAVRDLQWFVFREDNGNVCAVGGGFANGNPVFICARLHRNDGSYTLVETKRFYVEESSKLIDCLRSRSNMRDMRHLVIRGANRYICEVLGRFRSGEEPWGRG